MKLKRYIISYTVLLTLLRGEHHYKMEIGIPSDAKILSFKNWAEGKSFVDILVESSEFETEYDNLDQCKEYGNLRLYGLPCMPLETEKVG